MSGLKLEEEEGDCLTKTIDKTPNIALVAQPQAYFRDLIVEALERQRVAAQPETEFYLVNLLNQFMTTDHLYSRDQEGGARDEPLAFMLKEALEVTQPRARTAMFRHIGDVSLYKAGFFQESLSRKRVNLDYYIGLGGTAYQRVASLTDEELQRRIYEELSLKFGAFVTVLADVSEKTTPRTEKELLQVYAHWIETQNERAAKTLRKAGINVPARGVIKKGLK